LVEERAVGLLVANGNDDLFSEQAVFEGVEPSSCFAFRRPGISRPTSVFLVSWSKQHRARVEKI
jgi:hypothetical protein